MLNQTQTAKKVVTRPIVPLLLASYQFRQVTLETLSKHVGIPLDESGDRLQTSPWTRLAIIREHVLTGHVTGLIAAELESIARSSPTLAVYIYANASFRELKQVPKMYNVKALTVGDSQFRHAQILWDDALRLAKDGCDKALLTPWTARPMLVQYAQNTLVKAIVAQRYGMLLTTLVRSVQVLLAFQAYDAKRTEGDPARLPGYLTSFLHMLQRADHETHVERKHGVHAEAAMLDIQTISNLCALLQRVAEIDMPESEVYDECKTLARKMKDEYEEQLCQMQETQPAAASS